MVALIPPPTEAVSDTPNWRSWFSRVQKSILQMFNTTATTATAGSGTLPANPVGFIIIQINGVSYKIPYYNT